MQGQSADTGGASGAVLSTAVLGIRTVSAFNLQNAAHARYTACPQLYPGPVALLGSPPSWCSWYVCCCSYVELYQSTFATRLREAVTGGFLLGYTQVCVVVVVEVDDGDDGPRDYCSSWPVSAPQSSCFLLAAKRPPPHRLGRWCSTARTAWCSSWPGS